MGRVRRFGQWYTECVRLGGGGMEKRMARLICIAVLLTLMAFLPGCGGCRHPSDADKTPEELEKELLERKKQEAERAKPDFQAKFLVSRPPTERPTMGCFAKPGQLPYRTLRTQERHRQ